jgi:hypothetical protein
MFQNSNKDQRKYCCYVCGVLFDVFEEFTTHIIEKHEEGRDYVLCPLERCKCPVRDVKLHYKVKHPSEKLPTKGLMKAIVWRDISTKGKVKVKKRNFREGYHHSTKMGKDFYHRSGYEKKIFELLDEWHEVMAYDVEPFKIPYIHEGEVHQYTPDVFVAYQNGKKEIWEIKPANQTNLPKNKDKWEAANLACQARGWEFTVLTEKGINMVANKVKQQFMENKQEDED